MPLRRVRQRLPYRVQLAIAFGATALGAGLLVMTLLYAFLRYVPSYLITPIDPSETSVVGETTSDGGGGEGGINITDVSSLLDTVLWAGIAILLLLSAVAAAFGWFIAGRMLAPLSHVGEAARKAGEGTLSHRIALTGPRDEIRDLADTFDRTLDRLEHAFHAHERFTANVAHELRTPLTTAKTLLDVASAYPEATEPTRLVQQLKSNNDRNIELVQALLALTELERPAPSSDDIDLADLVHEVAQETIPGSRPTTMDLRAAPTRADAVLARLLVHNLVQNALRHNDDRAVIEITTREAEGQSTIRIENTGAVLTLDEVSRLSEPLYRPDRSSQEGHGLGLAIVESIARAQGASLALEPRPGGGLIATVSFRAAGHTI
ncbi:sensor histidine kinase [Zhihengliuella sp. ISTPL4]|uniref:sensor histidine kinase n=1 Tax=Zhihengliuella sp. ISTPL4 TaxID=2058657 RepID=UPI000C7BBBC9|nr:HAMP domain-containing sensor histidine kinase [Zhihengliuella sp. ISTPL4]